MNFTWIAEDYYQHSQFQYEHAQLALSHYQFKGDEHILDVGCGDGRITAEIAKKAPLGSVIGIDNSPTMITFAEKTFQDDNLTFEIGDAEKIYYKNKFDLIVSFACLHWVKNQLAFLCGAKSALKINGKVILTLYPKHRDIWQAIEKTSLEPQWNKYFLGYKNPHICYDIESYIHLCEKANLTIDYINECIPVAYFKTSTEAKAFIKSWLPHTNQIDTSLTEDFLEDIMQRFLQTSHYSQDHIGIPFRRIDAMLTNISA